jgi:tetratricopeptide (TPR) repeat protein
MQQSPLLAKFSINPGISKLNQGKALWQKVLTHYKTGTIDPDANSYQNHPQVIERKNLISEAIKIAEQGDKNSIQYFANSATGYQELGLLHRATNDFENAKISFAKSLSLLNSASSKFSKHPAILTARRETLFRLGELNHVLGNKEVAISKYKETLEIDELLEHNDPIGEKTTRALLDTLL